MLNLMHMTMFEKVVNYRLDIYFRFRNKIRKGKKEKGNIK